MSAIASDVMSSGAYRLEQTIDAPPSSKEKLMSIEGRIGVLTYNARYFGFLMLMLIGFAPMMGYMAIVGEGEPATVPMIVSSLLAIVCAVVAMYGLVLNSAKRLHDLDFGGLHMVWGYVPIIGGLWMLYYSLKPGSEERNRFGAARSATGIEKVVGYIGITFIVLLVFSALVSA
ncbi:MAG: DUF805 domain-containing protein [Granulosicoccus sp.]